MVDTKNKILIAVIAGYTFLVLLTCIGKKPEEYSLSERRKLQQMPELTIEGVLDGTVMSALESYVLDQFPARDTFRRIKAYASTGMLRQKDNDGIYIEDGYACAIEYPMNEKSMNHAAERFRYIYDTYLKPHDLRTFFAMIPDKNYFMAQQSNHLSVDYALFFEKMKEKTDYMEHIDIAHLLEKEDYYCTDTHWRQERITDVAKLLAEKMGVEITMEYEKVERQEPFYGVYYGQAALPLQPDKICYLTNEILEQCSVYDFEHNKEIAIYDLEKANGRDPYEMFLSGPLSLITIENPNAIQEKELVVFRDSFGSSITPLLVEGYKKITLVDIRYMSSQILDRFIEFQNQDVLFLYSTQVLNHSETIK